MRTPHTEKSEDTGGPEGSLLSNHILLTVLGTNPQLTRYRLGDSENEAQLAPLALLDLLAEDARPGSVIALCTPEAADESGPLLRQALDGRCPVTLVPVPAGDSQEDVDGYLKKVTQSIPRRPDVHLTVDVTHGYRHFSFLTYMAVLYLAALRGVRVRGAYYGLLRRDGPSPFLDLRPLLELPRWLHAIQVFRDSGSASPLASAVEEGPPSASAREISRDLRHLSEAYLSGLPLELGHLGSRFRSERMKPIKRLLKKDHHLPLADELAGWLGDLLDPFCLRQPGAGHGWKQNVPLSRSELERQALLIDDLLSRESTATALGLMNEWTVSWAAWRLGDNRSWLDFQAVRRGAASQLGATAAVGRDPDLAHLLTTEQQELGEFWTRLCELRNAYHHHGMRPQVLVGSRELQRKLEAVCEYWGGTLRCCPDYSIDIGGSQEGVVLVSPLGRRPGVLLSAVHACRDIGLDPTCCLVVCSAETEESIAEATERARYTGAVEPLRLEDPYGGRSEIDHATQRARKLLLRAERVVVNVTGGTTLMGLAVEALAGVARDLARPVRRFGLIDRRPGAQQDADPYQVGEPFWLDKAEDVDGNDD